MARYTALVRTGMTGAWEFVDLESSLDLVPQVGLDATEFAHNEENY